MRNDKTAHMGYAFFRADILLIERHHRAFMDILSFTRFRFVYLRRHVTRHT